MNRPTIPPTPAAILKALIISLGNTGQLTADDVALILALLGIQEA